MTTFNFITKIAEEKKPIDFALNCYFLFSKIVPLFAFVPIELFNMYFSVLVNPKILIKADDGFGNIITFLLLSVKSSSESV